MEAAKIAIRDANVSPNEIDLVVYCGHEGNWLEPGTAHVIQHSIGANAVCLDVSNACHGFMNGFSVVDAMIMV